MLFTQHAFLAFLVLVLIGDRATRRWRAANHGFLLLASWAFFLYWSLTDFLIFLGAMLAGFVFVAALGRASGPRLRRALLLGAVSLSLGMLALFKYRQFFGANLGQLLHACGWSWPALSDTITIPLAISFYTFHMISLVCDVHARKYPAPGFLDYALYLSFFPQMLAGPIVRGDQMLPQLARPPRERVADVAGGLYAFVLGFFFKAVIADHLAVTIDPCWTDDGVRGLTVADAWLAALFYSAQIFADFGGYSFMAIGLGKLLGFELPTNFDAPYVSSTFQEFWRRWHITLSSFLRDYLYIAALGGSRGPRWRTPINLILTMLLGGLWHGPAWNFIAWGGVHGGALAVERWAGFALDARRSRLTAAFSFAVVQLTVVLAWVLFRAPNLALAARFYGRLLGLGAGASGLHVAPELARALPLVAPVLLYHLARAWAPAEVIWRAPILRGALTGALLYAALVFMHSPRGFIYFVF